MWHWHVHIMFTKHVHTTAECPQAPRRLVTRSIVLDGKFEDLITGASMYMTFLRECTDSLSSGGRTVECVDLRPGSIVVDIRGTESAVEAAVLEVAIIGLNLPSFPRLMAKGQGDWWRTYCCV